MAAFSSENNNSLKQYFHFTYKKYWNFLKYVHSDISKKSSKAFQFTFIFVALILFYYQLISNHIYQPTSSVLSGNMKNIIIPFKLITLYVYEFISASGTLILFQKHYL